MSRKQKPNDFASRVCIDDGCRVVEGSLAELEDSVDRLQRRVAELSEVQAWKEVEIERSENEELESALAQKDAEISRLRELAQSVIDADELGSGEDLPMAIGRLKDCLVGGE